MAQSQSTTNIVKEVPELNQFEVEYEGNKFDCNRCREKEKCCGTEDDTFSFQLQCKKCRCQHLHDVTDNSRTNRVKDLNCGDECNNNALDVQTCESYGYLTNNLKANVMDCSNNLINVGANSTIEGVELRSKCTSTGGETAGVIKVNPNKGSTGKTNESEKIMMYAAAGGGIFFCLLLFLMLMM